MTETIRAGSSKRRSKRVFGQITGFFERLVPLALIASFGCRTPATRETALTAVVEEVVVGDVNSLVTHSRALDRAATDFQQTPSATTLAATRAHWLATAVAWQKAAAFRNGPLIETSALVRATYWPPRTNAVQAFLHSDQRIDDASIDTLGVDEKGLFTLEYLLFAQDDHLLQVGNRSSERTRQLIGSLAHSVARYAETSAHAMGDGAPYAATFGRKGQESLNRLVNQMTVSIETVYAGRLNRLLVGTPNATSNDLLPGSRSAALFPLLHASILANQNLYLGGASGGISAVVKAVAPNNDARIRAAFTRAENATAALGETPLTQALSDRRPAIEAAAQATKELEVALKVDMASALGVTLVFTGADAD